MVDIWTSLGDQRSAKVVQWIIPLLLFSPQSTKIILVNAQADSIFLELLPPQPLRPARADQLFLEHEYEPLKNLDIKEPLSEEFLEKIKHVYINDFAKFFDEFLESEWYTHHGLEVVLNNISLLKMLGTIIQLSEYSDTREESVTMSLLALESKVVWNLLACVRGPPYSDHALPANGHTNGHAVTQFSKHTANGLAVTEATSPFSENGDISTNGNTTTEMNATDKVRDETIKRLALLEAALTNETLHCNPLASLQYSPEELTDKKKDEVAFWNFVANFVVVPVEKNLDQSLFEMWDLLKGIQSRDIIYSILICRHYGSRIPGFPENFDINWLDDPGDPFASTSRAKTLVYESIRSGPNIPIRRICQMAARSWSIAKTQLA